MGDRHRSITLPSRVVASVVLMGPLLLLGCSPGVEPEDPDAHADAEPTHTVDPAWSVRDEEPLATVAHAETDTELQDAMAAARATAADARDRWNAASDQDSWLIKWEAPLLDGGVEYLWVRPESWTAFRIEGILTNAPVRPLEFEARQGDRVSFPVEQLADWIHFSDPADPTTFEGGTTQTLILERHGPPPG